MRKSPWVLFVVGIVLAIAGCSKDGATAEGGTTGGGGATSDPKAAVVGKYKLELDLTEVAEAEKETMTKMAAEMPEISMDLKADGTADLLARGDNLTAKWTLEGTKLTVTPDNEGEEPGVFEVKDGGATLVPTAEAGMDPINGAKPIFKKQ